MRYNKLVEKSVKIIGAGLAGVECAYYLANKGINVILYEMRPTKMTHAHTTEYFAELVCSNSLKSDDYKTASGLLKAEMRLFDSLVLEAANYTSVKAGSSLAVDRELFAKYITDKISNHPNITVIKEEVTKIDTNELVVVAAGPLASDKLSQSIEQLFSSTSLHFYDAIAPIIDAASINYDIVYLKSRYDKGEAAYLNCPMTKDEYDLFYHELINANSYPIKDFEVNVFEGCMPVEVMAKRGYETLTYGPLRPVGLEINDNMPYAVVQLRQDDYSGSMYNIVGFQTNLLQGEQKRVFRLIPGLENAKFIRYGLMHKNTYIESPNILNSYFQSKEFPNLFFAGQISGVEGYMESAASGIMVGVNIYQLLNYNFIKPFPIETIMGSLAGYISTPNRHFVPMNANFGIIPELGYRHKKKERKELYATRSLNKMKEYKELLNERN